MRIAAICAALCLVFTATTANAHPYRHHHHQQKHLHPVVQGLGAGLAQMLKFLDEKSNQVGPGEMPTYGYNDEYKTSEVAPQPRPKRAHRSFTYRHIDYNGHDPRPRAWCGWWMRHLLGVADRSFNLAREWAHYGSNAGGPRAGAIVVWRHHVGIIVAQGSGGRWLVKSGNDGHAVRERERSLAGAIAFRWPGGGRYASN
jgi:hypothetical protein